MMRRFLRWILVLLYGFKATNEETTRISGPVILIPNHVSWLDWLLIAVCLDEDWRFVTSRKTAETSWVHRKIMVNRFTFPIDMNSPYAVKRMAEFLDGGGKLVLFAEGRISITGSLMKLYDGTGFLIHNTNARVITCYLRGANRLRWVRHQGWTKWFPRVSAHFSEPVRAPHLEHVSAPELRARITLWLSRQLEFQQFDVEMAHGPRTILAAVSDQARLRPRDIVLEDMTRQCLTFRRLMTGVRLLAARFRTMPEFAGAEPVGLLLPNVNATPVVILALWNAGRIPALLNFSSGSASMLTCARLAGLRHIITSRLFIERAKIEIKPFEEAGVRLHYLEDLRSTISKPAQLAALAKQSLFPRSGIREPTTETAVILFTSGSEGEPKGVELTHQNLIANIRQMLAVIDIEDDDRLFNCLPLFHSFGLTVGTFLPLVRGIYTFLYPSPLHYRVIPEAVYDRACTIMLSTNTFLNGYARKAHPYDFRSIRYLFAAAEKLQDATAQHWAEKFGVRVLEGYGATECGPCLSVNTGLHLRHGSAGRLLPGVEYRLEPVDGVEEGAGELFVRGPNIMSGYLNPEADRRFKKLGGWYDTGDIARVDESGFVFILGRLKRFAKISGEMVSLTAVENALAGAFPAFGQRCQVAVLSRPDEEKGESLIAVTNEKRLTLDQIRQALRSAGFPNIAVPRAIQIVREIPKLGTGKVNHRELEKILASEPAFSEAAPNAG